MNKKLISYSRKLKEIDSKFREMKLSELSEEKCGELIGLIIDTCALINNAETKIYGIGASYLSAILNAYFPNLIPILDRRVLINMK